MNYQSKMLLGVTFLSAILAGCASTDTDSSGDAGAGDGMSTYVDKSADANANSGYQMDVDPASLETVFYFDFDQATLDAGTRADLDAQIARLKKTTGPVRLEGHADERGTREYNIALGERRANAVADYMAINGIPRYRIETVSYGEERPAAFGQSEASYAKNRRVELK
jgi:peptidoglycan-associated lipoprotein